MQPPSAAQPPPAIRRDAPPHQQDEPFQAPTEAPTPTEDPGNGTRNIAALLSYLFGWVGGLIIYLTQTDREVRFHAAQSILTFGGLAVLTVILSVTNVAGSVILATIVWLLVLLSFVLWIFLSIQGYQLKHTKLPLVGNLAERWVTK